MTATTPPQLAREPAHQAATAAPARRGVRLRAVVGIALAVVLLAELGVRVIEDRLPPPPDWYTGEYVLKQEQMERLRADHGGASVVFLGSSVVDVAIDPTQIDAPLTADRPAYNAGLIGANLEMVDFWSEHLVEPTLQPDVALLAVSSRDVNANGLGLETQTEGFYDLPAVRRILGVESIAEQVERRIGDLSHLARHRMALRRPLEALFGYDAPDRNIPENATSGQELHLLDEPYRGDAFVLDFFRREPLVAFQPSQRQFGALRAMITRLESRGVRVVLLDVPVTEQYVALHPNGAADYAGYEVAVNVLAAQTGVELIDAGTWGETSFSDPLHLNGAGASQLTELVDGYLAGEGVRLPAGAAPATDLTGGVAEPVTSG